MVYFSESAMEEFAWPAQSPDLNEQDHWVIRERCQIRRIK